jgi:hypothetical protein
LAQPGIAGCLLVTVHSSLVTVLEISAIEKSRPHCERQWSVVSAQWSVELPGAGARGQSGQAGIAACLLATVRSPLVTVLEISAIEKSRPHCERQWSVVSAQWSVELPGAGAWGSRGGLVLRAVYWSLFTRHWLLFLRFPRLKNRGPIVKGSGQGTGSRAQGTGDRGQGAGDRGQGTGDREQGTGNREQGTARSPEAADLQSLTFGCQLSTVLVVGIDVARESCQSGLGKLDPACL